MTYSIVGQGCSCCCQAAQAQAQAQVQPTSVKNRLDQRCVERERYVQYVDSAKHSKVKASSTLLSTAALYKSKQSRQSQTLTFSFLLLFSTYLRIYKQRNSRNANCKSRWSIVRSRQFDSGPLSAVAPKSLTWCY
jgi:hypothetical protein